MSKTDFESKKLPRPPPSQETSPNRDPHASLHHSSQRRFYLKLRSPVEFQPMGNETMMGGPNNGMGPGGPQMGPQQQVMVPSYSMYAGTPTHVANMKVRSNVPSFLAENELKLEILKRQHISQAQVCNVFLRIEIMKSPEKAKLFRFI